MSNNDYVHNQTDSYRLLARKVANEYPANPDAIESLNYVKEHGDERDYLAHLLETTIKRLRSPGGGEYTFTALELEILLRGFHYVVNNASEDLSSEVSRYTAHIIEPILERRLKEILDREQEMLNNS